MNGFREKTGCRQMRWAFVKWRIMVVAGLTLVLAHASTSIGATSSGATQPCLDIKSAADPYGLCNAYVSMRCHELRISGKEQACQRIETNFLRITGRALSQLFAQSVTRNVSSFGDSVSLDGLITAYFPAGTFETDAVVTISSAANKQFDELFDETTIMSAPRERAAYPIRINTGNQVPRQRVEVVVVIPSELAGATLPGFQVEALVRMVAENEFDSLPSVEIFNSEALSSGRALRLRLPLSAFSQRWTGDGTFEAVMTLAVTEGVTR